MRAAPEGKGSMPITRKQKRGNGVTGNYLSRPPPQPAPRCSPVAYAKQLRAHGSNGPPNKRMQKTTGGRNSQTNEPSQVAELTKQAWGPTNAIMERTKERTNEDIHGTNQRDNEKKKKTNESTNA